MTPCTENDKTLLRHKNEYMEIFIFLGGKTKTLLKKISPKLIHESYTLLTKIPLKISLGKRGGNNSIINNR